MMKRVAVVFAGCGVYDGTEVHEASAVMVHLSRNKVDYEIFAPNINQAHVIDHTKGEPDATQTRNVLTESARIARGKISCLSTIDSTKFNAIIFPGGFGAAKNLSTFALSETPDKMTVNEHVEKVIKEFLDAKKVLGFCCIAPVIAAKCIPGVKVTMGGDAENDGEWPYAGATGAVKILGGEHVVKNMEDICVDEENRVVSSAAFMNDKVGLHVIHDNVGMMVKKVVEMC